MTYFEAKGDLNKIGMKRLQQGLLILFIKTIFFLVAPALLAWFWFTNGYEDLAIIAVIAYVSLWAVIKIIGFLGRIFGTKRLSPQEKAMELWQEMLGVYTLLEGPVVNPQRVHEAMTKSAEKGAVWSGAAYALVDRMRAESPDGMGHVRGVCLSKIDPR